MLCEQDYFGVNCAIPRSTQVQDAAARKASGSDKPSLETVMPEVFRQFTETTQILERHYRDIQDFEFCQARERGQAGVRAAVRAHAEVLQSGQVGEAGDAGVGICAAADVELRQAGQAAQVRQTGIVELGVRDY